MADFNFHMSIFFPHEPSLNCFFKAEADCRVQAAVTPSPLQHVHLSPDRTI